MAIIVRYGDYDEQDTYTKATKWVIDDQERLHIVGAEGNISSFNRGCWASVYRAPDQAATITAHHDGDPVATAKQVAARGADLRFNN